jgi:hypothetical protein
VEGPPAGQGGKGFSSPELLADGEERKNRDGGGVLRRGGCSGGRQGSASGWEGRGDSGASIPGEKKAARGLLGAPLTVEEVTMAEAVEAPPIGRLLTVSSCTNGEKVVRGGRHGRRERRAAASDQGCWNAGGFIPTRLLRQAPPLVANGMPVVADIATDVRAPHVSIKEFKRNTKTGF